MSEVIPVQVGHDVLYLEKDGVGRQSRRFWLAVGWTEPPRQLYPESLEHVIRTLSSPESQPRAALPMSTKTLTTAALGSPVPPFTPHAISVCLPTWKDNVGYEEGEKRVIDSMVTGYPRFFIHRSIQKVCDPPMLVHIPPCIPDVI